MAPPPITLKQIDADGLPALQALYEASADYFIRHSGAAARPEQAALTYRDVLEWGDRVLLGVWWERESLIGCLDVRFDHPAAGIAWLGALILRDELPAPREEIGAWSVRILEEWLRTATPIREVRLAAPASAREEARFWVQLGYRPLPETIRQPIGPRRERLIVFTRKLEGER
ncbi:MAG: hypothetical protein GXP42_03285 [Chloroflexi bacterium]|nr:hypothetical protein [Chloroflexota bacterium]